MRELHGAVYADDAFSVEQLKRQALLIDRFFVLDINGFLGSLQGADYAEAEATFSHLENQGMLQEMPPFTGPTRVFNGAVYGPTVSTGVFHDIFARDAAAVLTNEHADGVALIPEGLPEHIPPIYIEDGREELNKEGTVFSVALDAMPIPGSDCAWQDIIDFKAEMHDKQWAFRRFLNTLATKQQTEAQIRDDLEYSIHEYSKAMDRMKLKRSVGSLETYVIPGVEALESFNFKLSTVLKYTAAIKKRKLELLECEANAVGRECAYVFDARQRFGQR
jgi:hypothetical protein